MSKNYIVAYTKESLNDLREIYSYIAEELLVPEIAVKQVDRIREEVRSLNIMPARYALVGWEPWHSAGMRQLPVGNFVIYYLIDNEACKVIVVRIFYGGRDITGIVGSDK